MKKLKTFKNKIQTKSGPIVITMVCTNQEKKGTCGSCFYTDNELGFFALKCTCKKKEAKQIHWDEWGKVRSWEKCACWKARRKK